MVRKVAALTRGVIKLRGDYSALSRWAHYNQKSLHLKEGGLSVRVVWYEKAIAGFEDGRGATECRWSPEAGKGKETDFPLEPPKGTCLSDPSNLAQ